MQLLEGTREVGYILLYPPGTNDHSLIVHYREMKGLMNASLPGGGTLGNSTGFQYFSINQLILPGFIKLEYLITALSKNLKQAFLERG